MRINIECAFSEGWWGAHAIEAPEIFTQARELSEIPFMVRDAISLFPDLDSNDLDLVLLVPEKDLENASRYKLPFRKKCQDKIDMYSWSVRCWCKNKIKELTKKTP